MLDKSKINLSKSEEASPESQVLPKQADHPPKDPDRFTWSDFGEILSDAGRVIIDVIIDCID